MVDVERAQTFEVRGEPHQEPGVILSLFRRPHDFGKGAHAGEGHVLHLLGLRHVLRPQLPLRAEHMPGELWLQFRRDGLERVDLFDRDLFGYLVLFSLAALLLWLRAALVERRSSWQLRRVNENIDVPASIMRSGVLFTAASIGLAWILTSVAVAAPLTSAVREKVDPGLAGLRRRGERLLPGAEQLKRAAGVLRIFGPSMTVGPSAGARVTTRSST